MAEVLAHILGVLGFLLACAALGWHVWTYRSDRKERIGAKLSIGARIGFPEPTLWLYVWNLGRVPVYIKEVVLEMSNEKGELGKEVWSMLLQAHPACSDALQPGQAREYVLSANHYFIKRGSDLQEDDVSLVVRSPKGELLRIRGSEVSVYLRALAQAM